MPPGAFTDMVMPHWSPFAGAGAPLLVAEGSPDWEVNVPPTTPVLVPPEPDAAIAGVSAPIDAPIAPATAAREANSTTFRLTSVPPFAGPCSHWSVFERRKTICM